MNCPNQANLLVTKKKLMCGWPWSCISAVQLVVFIQIQLCATKASPISVCLKVKFKHDPHKFNRLLIVKPNLTIHIKQCKIIIQNQGETYRKLITKTSKITNLNNNNNNNNRVVLFVQLMQHFIRLFVLIYL